MRNDENAMRERFTANLRAFMAASGMSGKELAEAAGLTQAAVSRYVNGNRVPKADAAAALAGALGTTVDSLYGLKADAGALEDAVALVVAHAGELTRGQRVMIACACAGVGPDD